jgi:putative ABC transport system permease protein
MLRNYFRVALRSLSRNKEYSLINIGGLATGIAVCLLIFLVVRNESSFDDFHTKRDHIYRVVTLDKEPQGLDYEPGVPFPTAAALRHDFPQLPAVASILSLGGDGQVNVLDNAGDTHSDKKFMEESGILYAEPQFFGIFDFKWLAGDKTTALTEPNTVVLTRKMAEKYFGDWQSATGRYLRIKNFFTVKVTGVLADPPANTDFPLKVVLSYATLKNIGFASLLNSWSALFVQHYCFVVLPDGLTEQQFDKDLAGIVKKYKPAENQNEGMRLLPLKDMHFDTRYSTFNGHKFSKDLIVTLSLVALFVLVIACVNFINMATAQAINRSKDIGIRKVLGSTRLRLVLQFLSEAGILVLFATFVAVCICAITLPYFDKLLAISVDRAFLTDPAVIMMIGVIVVGTTLLAGGYPAVVISGFKPVTAFRNKTGAGSNGGNWLRRVLVVLQFTISQALIIGVLIVIGQLDYFRSAPMGFDKEAIVITQIPDNSKIASLRNRLAQLPGIEKMSFSFASPIDDNDWYNGIEFNNVPRPDAGGVILKWADADYPSTYRLQLAAGKWYSASDTVKDLVVNQAFLRKLGLRDPNKAVGAKLKLTGAGQTGRITGVVRDFNISSLQDTVSPVVMGTWMGTYGTLNLRIAPAQIGRVLPQLERIWKSTFPDDVYEYRFLDENIAGYYRQEEQLGALYKLFAGIAILLSCLGLYSLVSFVVVQRAKEMGIRKTLGATVANILALFSREFALMILIAFFIAAPVAWFLMHRWLQNYAFHIKPGPGVFLLAITMSVVIAALSIGYKTIKAALANPVETLKTE